MIHSGVIPKASSLLIKKTDFHFFPYLMSYPPGRFNMETLWAGRILTPKRPIAANRNWIGLISTVFADIEIHKPLNLATRNLATSLSCCQIHQIYYPDLLVMIENRNIRYIWAKNISTVYADIEIHKPLNLATPNLATSLSCCQNHQIY